MNATTVFERLDDPTDHLYGLDNADRMIVLAGIDLDHPRLRTELDAITARTAARLGLPISLITLVLDTAQVFAGSHGLSGWLTEAGGTPVEWSFCAHTVAAGRPYVIVDTRTDPVHAGNPLVAMAGDLSYAGVPLTIDDQVVGAHCVIGGPAHTFTDTDLVELQSAAADIIAVLQRHRTWR